jgi:hypothetical protein
MSPRSAIYAAIIIIVMVGLVILQHLIPIASSGRSEDQLSPNDVRGMAVVYKGKPYTLNFEQQLEMVEYINRLIPIGKLRDTPTTYPGLDKVMVYLFNRTPLEFIPLDFDNTSFVFRAPALRPQGYLMDITNGQLLHLIESAHDL